MRGTFSDPYELKRFTGELNAQSGKKQYGICADLGVCNLVGQNIYEFLTLLGDAVKAVIVRENDGRTDSALIPFSVSNRGAGRMDYLVWQISMERRIKKYRSRVLFGAGNMCRNYIRCYGEAFPPLFTCDNDKAHWGEHFEGLEIRPPEALKQLPADCAVFICNIYYKEIKNQLCEMRIQNPIEYFSDEFMPSYVNDLAKKK
ncbi:MAG: hypothetical protein HFI64_00310 [Lachnospiraceae bacterium]|nr:hypothetical protein [Lachnospiraceae bacterium]